MSPNEYPELEDALGQHADLCDDEDPQADLEGHHGLDLAVRRRQRLVSTLTPTATAFTHSTAALECPHTPNTHVIHVVSACISSGLDACRYEQLPVHDSIVDTGGRGPLQAR
jgi:hypothetical protein